MSFSEAALLAALEASLPAAATGMAVALSGGRDSASLLAALAALGSRFRGLPVRAVHVDHGLQEAAVEFRDTCSALCRRLHIPLAVIPVTIDLAGGVSVEAAARAARYAALAAQLRAGECLLTAHHRQDQAETLLLQALRGAGLKGMSAMPDCEPLGAGWHARPVLGVRQSELRALGTASYGALTAGEAGPGIDDPMNSDLRFDRVYLRRQVWPAIEARWPGVETALSRAARHLADAQDLLDDTAAADVAGLRDGEALSVPGLRALSSSRRVHALRSWLREAGVEAPSAARLTEALRQMLDADMDHLPAVEWGEHALRRYRERVFLTPVRLPRMEPPRQWTVQRSTVRVAPASLDLGPGLGSLRWIALSGGIDAARLPAAVAVRAREGGEALKRAPHARTQSVQHLCQSLGILPWLRDALPFVFAGDALIAVADLWLDARWCTPPGTPGLGIVWQGGPIMV